MLNGSMGQNQQGGIGGGLVGLISAIPQYIAQLKVKKQQDELASMVAGNQELDIYRKQAQTPGFKPTPEWLQAVTGIARKHNITLPFQSGGDGTVTPTSGGPASGTGLGLDVGQQPTDAGLGGAVAPAGGAPSAGGPPNGRQTQQPTGPQLDLNSFTGQNPFADVVKQNSVAIMEADPDKRAAIVEPTLGRPLTAQEKSQLKAMPQQLPPAQQEAEQKAVDTLVGGQLKQAAQQGTASALTAVVRFNYGRFQKAGYTDDQINALLDPALDQLSPAELNKIAAGSATAGLKTAQAQYIQQSAQAKIDKIQADVQLDQDRGAELKAQASSVTQLIPAKMASLRASATAAYARASEATSKNAQANAEASYYSERATDLKTNGNPRAITSALTSIRAAKASTDASIRSIDSDITRIQTSLTSLSPQAKTQNDSIIAGLKQQKQTLQDRSQQYDTSITTLTNKIAPGSLDAAKPPAKVPSGRNADGTPSTSVPVGIQPGAMIGDNPIYHVGGKWVFGDGSPAQ